MKTKHSKDWEYDINKIKQPFSFATYRKADYANPKKREDHIKCLMKYLEALVKHSHTDKCRIIENAYSKSEIDQPEFFCVKEKISWGVASKIISEIQKVTNQINILENEQSN